MKIKLGVILVCSIFSLVVFAQTEENNPLKTINEGLMIGIDGANIKNTYLSPHKYTGWGIRAMNERMKYASFSNKNISLQQIFNINIASVNNPAGTLHAYSGIVDYSYGFHYRFHPTTGLKILAGSSLKGIMGVLYNSQSANNSIAVNADIDINLSAAAIYSFEIKNYPITVRYQADIPVMGALFTPKFGQSYYEIFGLGNTSGIISFSSLHNKLAIRNYFTMDLPLWNHTIRLAYLNNLYYTDIHKIKVHNIANSFMLGIAKEYVAFGGKQLKKRNLQSSYY